MFRESFRKLMKNVNGYGTMEPEEETEEEKKPVKYSGRYFNDGRRQIDFILVWTENSKESPTKTMYRNKFQNNLKDIGLELEEESEVSGNATLHYVKVYAPWEVMCHYAELIVLRAPLQSIPNKSDDWSARVLRFLHIPNFMLLNVPNQPPDYYTCEFKQSKIKRFLGSDNRETFFTATQRQQVVNEILETQLYGRRRKGQVGIYRMIEDEIYDAAYCLHDGPYEITEEEKQTPENLNPRQVLYEYWARYGRWYKYQPLDHIREYYGERIGMYFAWLGLYTAWLLPASILGILIFIYGLITFGNNVETKEICDKKSNFTMCPLCDENIGCPYWKLSDVCLFVKASHLFDNEATVLFSVFMTLWAVTFLEFWKRKNASLAHHWDVMSYEEEEERPRPQYSALCSSFQKNPVTGAVEPHFPSNRRLPRILTGISCIIMMVTLVVIFIIAVIIYRVLIEIPMFQDPLLRSNALTYANGTSAIVNLLLIMCLAQVYEIIARKLTEWEMHRSQTDFEDQLIFKVFIFQFFNFYSSIFYIGFFKGRFVGYPGNYGYFFGLRNENCESGGCLIELSVQLIVIMIGKQIISNVQEIILPRLKTWFHRFSRRLGDVVHCDTDADSSEVVIYKEDYKLIPHEGLLEEYLEMVLQFGFITIFISAFPLAPFFALLNNWMELRLDAQKLVCETRRPVAERGKDIGVWFPILQAIASVACICNAFLLSFTSEFVPKIHYFYTFGTMENYTNHSLAWAPQNSTKQPCRYVSYRDLFGNLTKYHWQLLAVRLGFVIVFEHGIFALSRLLDLLIPDVPRELYIKVKREAYLAKQALQDADFIDNDANENEKVA